jgi:hypothetical protein
MEANNEKLPEKNFATRFLIRPSSHEENIVPRENNIKDGVCICS